MAGTGVGVSEGTNVGSEPMIPSPSGVVAIVSSAVSREHLIETPVYFLFVRQIDNISPSRL